LRKQYLAYRRVRRSVKKGVESSISHNHLLYHVNSTVILSEGGTPESKNPYSAKRALSGWRHCGRAYHG